MFGRSNKDKSPTNASRWLIVGLGNPGPEYEKTRHNIGAMVAAHMANVAGVKFSSHKARANVAEFRIGVGVDAPSLVVATLRCYMNESGGPTSSLLNFYKIPVENMIVMHDELDLPFGEIRIKQGKTFMVFGCDYCILHSGSFGQFCPFSGIV